MTYHSCLRSCPVIRSMLGAPLVTDQRQASCFTISIWPQIQSRQECAPQTNSGRLPYQLRRSNKLYQATAHTWPLRWQYPPYLHAIPANSHTRSRRPFFSGVFPFSVSKGPVGRRCGNVQEKINGKLNYPDQYFVGLAPGQRPAKDRANSSAPSIWRSDD